MKRKENSLLLCMLLAAMMVAPVAGLAVVEGQMITSREGASTMEIIIENGLTQGGTITIDVTELNELVATGSFTEANVLIEDTAVAAVWTQSIGSNTLTLTSTEGATDIGETVILTFTGGAGNPWVASTGGERMVFLTAISTETSEEASFGLMIQTGGLEVTDGEKITTSTGSTATVITILDSPIAQDETITVDVSYLNWYAVASTALSDANVVMDDTATAALWTGMVDGDYLILTSTEGPTNPGETILITFTGEANPWVDNTGGSQMYPLTVSRSDGLGVGTISFSIETGAVGGLSVLEGAKITEREGTTSPVITLLDADIVEGGTINIDVRDLHMYVASGTFTDANVLIEDTAADALWTAGVEGDTLTLTSTGGATVAGETITVTFTGAGGNPWVVDTGGDYTVPLTTTRTDINSQASFNFWIEIAPRGISIQNGAKITSPDGTTSPVITILDTEIPEGDTISIDITGLSAYVANGNFSLNNVAIEDTSADAIWTGALAGETLTLTSTGGDTRVGDSIVVTFTGATSPWIGDTGGEQVLLLTATRSDGLGTGDFDFVIETVPPPPSGLSVLEGAKINTSGGSTSPVITINDADISEGGTLTINISGLSPYVAGGTFSLSNIVVNDTAARATWTGSLADDILTLTSIGGTTTIGETVIVTFTGGGGNPWVANTGGEQRVQLTATRDGDFGPITFYFVIETAPPPGYIVAASFISNRTVDRVPLTIQFIDTSSGHPTSWNWDFGDGETSASQSPVHTYTSVGYYTVRLTATNAYGSDTRSQRDYIHALNGGFQVANTAIPGLIISNCGGSPQQVTIDTQVLPVVLSSNQSVLEIHPPPGQGFSTITLYAQDVFSPEGSQVTGQLAGVHLVSAEISPTEGFSEPIGADASFWYSLDLSSYPCNALLNTTIWEGVVPEYDTKFRRVASENYAFPIGTAYTVTIERTNFPYGIPVQLYMSVNSTWNPYLTGGPGNVFIWWIREDGNAGQILPTTPLSTDPVAQLDLYTADSPSGLSTFGLSSLTGNNNPFQLISFFLQDVASSSDSSDSSDEANLIIPPTSVPSTPAPAMIPPTTTSLTDSGITAPLPTDTEGFLTQGVSLQSDDGLARIVLGEGVRALNTAGQPLESVHIRRLPSDEMPAMTSGTVISFAGVAYDIQPDGATFSPSFMLSFTTPTASEGREYIVQIFDRASAVWTEVPSTYDPLNGTIQADITHLCYVALFAQSSPAPETSTFAPTPSATLRGSSGFTIDIGMYNWLMTTIRENPAIILGILVLAAGSAYVIWKKRG